MLQELKYFSRKIHSRTYNKVGDTAYLLAQNLGKQVSFLTSKSFATNFVAAMLILSKEPNLSPFWILMQNFFLK